MLIKYLVNDDLLGVTLTDITQSTGTKQIYNEVRYESVDDLPKPIGDRVKMLKLCPVSTEYAGYGIRIAETLFWITLEENEHERQTEGATG